MDVIAVKKDGKIVSVGCGKHCFAVENNTLEKDYHMDEFYSKIGKSKEYNEAFLLCLFAYENDMYDKIEEFKS